MYTEYTAISLCKNELHLEKALSFGLNIMFLIIVEFLCIYIDS